MKKINLIALNSQFVHSSPAVADLQTMYCEYSKKFNTPLPELSVTELSINDSFDSFIYKIFNGADVFAFSVYIWNVSIVKKLCIFIKSAKPDSIIILGGPEVSYCDAPEWCDYVISGEGERAFYSLICELNHFSVPCEWNYTSENKIRKCKNAEDLSEFLLPYNDENIEEYRNKIIYYETSRGCPFSCSYCLSSVCGKVRELNTEQVKSDLDFFIRHNVNQVKFVDRTFNCNKKRAVEIWKYIIENATECDTNFHFEIGADLLYDESIKILSKAKSGQIQLEIGIQSTNEKTLDACCRHTDNKKLFDNIKKLIALGTINIHTDLIAGLPYENLEIFKKSFNDTYALKSHQLQLGFLKLLKGAPLNDIVDSHGMNFSNYPPYEIISTKYLSFDEVLLLKKIEDVVERFYNSCRFIRTLNLLEKYFSSPFEMFEKIAEDFEKNNLIFSPVSTKVLFNFMSDFSKKYADNFDKTILLDFYSSEKSEVLPSKLRYLNTHCSKSGKFIKTGSQKTNKQAQVRIIENTAYVIDYSSKDRVNGSFKICEVIENADL